MSICKIGFNYQADQGSDCEAIIDPRQKILAQIAHNMILKNAPETFGLTAGIDLSKILTSGRPMSAPDIAVFADIVLRDHSRGSYSQFDSPSQGIAALYALMLQRVMVSSEQIWKDTSTGENGARFLSCKGDSYPSFVVKIANKQDLTHSTFHGIDTLGAIKRECMSSQLAESLGITYAVPLTVSIRTNDGLISAQMFIPNEGSFKEYLHQPDVIASLDTDTLHKTALFDAIFSNTDRHLGNLLLNKWLNFGLMIDNEGILSNKPLEDRPKMNYTYLESMHQPLSPTTQEQLRSFDEKACKRFLLNQKISKTAINVMINKTLFLKYALLDSKAINPINQLSAREAALLCIHFHDDIVKESSFGKESKLGQIIDLILTLKQEASTPITQGQLRRMIMLGLKQIDIESGQKQFIEEEIIRKFHACFHNPEAYAAEHFKPAGGAMSIGDKVI